MPKYSGLIGFAKSEDRGDGVWEDKIIEKKYRGDILQNRYRWDTHDKVNDDFNITNSLSIVSDSFLLDNAYAIRYVTLLGARWEINSLEVKPPRLLLYIGGLYNGPGPESASEISRTSEGDGWE